MLELMKIFYGTVLEHSNSGHVWLLDARFSSTPTLCAYAQDLGWEFSRILEKIMAPEVQIIYNKYKCGIDLWNRLRFQYFRFGRSTNDGFFYVRFFISAWLTNAYLHFQALGFDKQVTHRQYLEGVVYAIFDRLNIDLSPPKPAPVQIHALISRTKDLHCRKCRSHSRKQCTGCPDHILCNKCYEERHREMTQ